MRRALTRWVAARERIDVTSWTVWLLTATLALTLLPSNVVPTAVPLLRQEWGTSDAELGGVFTAYRLGYLAAVLLILPLTDRFRASYVIGGCSAVAALSFLLFPFLAHDPWSAAVLRFVAGLGLAGRVPAGRAGGVCRVAPRA